jgi:hypothetical protein
MSEKFRVWESAYINESLKHALQIKENVEHLVEQNSEKLDLDNLPDSLVPTAMLYNLVCCYEALYNSCLTQDLLHTGNLKSATNNTH